MDWKINFFNFIPDFLELLSSLELTATPKLDKLIIGIVVGLRSRELVESRNRTRDNMITKNIMVTIKLPLSVLLPMSMERGLIRINIAIQTNWGEVQNPQNLLTKSHSPLALLPRVL